MLDSSKFKVFADDNFKLDEKWQKVLQRLVLQTRKNQGFFGKGLRTCRERTFLKRLESISAYADCAGRYKPILT